MKAYKRIEAVWNISFLILRESQNHRNQPVIDCMVNWVTYENKQNELEKNTDAYKPLIFNHRAISLPRGLGKLQILGFQELQNFSFKHECISP